MVLQESEKELLEQLKQMAVQYRTRPSLVSPLVSASGAALGALSAVLPRGLSDAVRGIARLAVKNTASSIPFPCFSSIWFPGMVATSDIHWTRTHLIALAKSDAPCSDADMRSPFRTHDARKSCQVWACVVLGRGRG